jgi:hypothetical protein
MTDTQKTVGELNTPKQPIYLKDLSINRSMRIFNNRVDIIDDHIPILFNDPNCTSFVVHTRVDQIPKYIEDLIHKHQIDQDGTLFKSKVKLITGALFNM